LNQSSRTKPDQQVLAACRHLRQLGYVIALDDVVDIATADLLCEFVDIIKVDFRGTTEDRRTMLCRRYAPRGVRMLAEKVESREEFDRAREAGYVLFQGYFFARPVILTTRDIPGFKLNYLRLLNEIHCPDLEFERLERLFAQEISIAYKLSNTSTLRCS
jgi:EAL and modified HD-GYP domain-containing signal transduction protein